MAKKVSNSTERYFVGILAGPDCEDGEIYNSKEKVVAYIEQALEEYPELKPENVIIFDLTDRVPVEFSKITVRWDLGIKKEK